MKTTVRIHRARRNYAGECGEFRADGPCGRDLGRGFSQIGLC